MLSFFRSAYLKTSFRHLLLCSWILLTSSVLSANFINVRQELNRIKSEAFLRQTQGVLSGDLPYKKRRVDYKYHELIKSLRNHQVENIDSNLAFLFRQFLSLLPHHLSMELDAFSTFELISHIEHAKNFAEFIDETRLPLLIRRLEQGTIVQPINYNSKDHLLWIQLHKSDRKQIYQVFNTESWKSWISFIPTYTGSKLRINFDQEWEVLNQLALLPSSQRVGVIQPLALKQNLISMPLYDEDLYTSVEISRSWNRLSFTRKLDLVQKLTQGLAHFHEAGYVHLDLKPENILIQNHPTQDYPLDIVLTDFEFAIQPKIMIQAGRFTKRPQVGTVTYLAPESLDAFIKPDQNLGWPGDTIEEMQENAFKTDVFSWGSIAFILLQSKYPTWYFSPMCKYYSNKNNFALFQACLDQELKAYAEKQSQTHFLSFLDLVLEASVRRDPSLRISSQQMLRGLQFVQANLTPSSETPISKNWEFFSPYQNRTAYPFKIITEELEYEALQFLTTFGRDGDYFLVRSERDGNRRTKVTFLENTQTRSLYLHSSSQDPVKIMNELSFLKDLKYIQSPIDMSALLQDEETTTCCLEERLSCIFHFITGGYFKEREFTTPLAAPDFNDEL